MEYSQDEIVYLDSKIVAAPETDKTVVITTDIFSKKRTFTSISVQIHVIPKIKPKMYHYSG